MSEQQPACSIEYPNALKLLCAEPVGALNASVDDRLSVCLAVCSMPIAHKRSYSSYGYYRILIGNPVLKNEPTGPRAVWPTEVDKTA